MSVASIQKQLDEITVQLRKTREQHEVEKQEFIKRFKVFRQAQEKKYVDLQIYCLTRMVSMLKVICKDQNLINNMNKAVAVAQAQQAKQSVGLVENFDLINQIELLKQQLEQAKTELLNKDQVLQQKESQIDDLLIKLKKAKQKLKSKGMDNDIDKDEKPVGSTDKSSLKMENFVKQPQNNDLSQAPYSPSHARLKATFHIKDTTQSILRIAQEYDEQRMASEYKQLRKTIAANALQLQTAHQKSSQIAKRAQSLQTLSKSSSFRRYQDKPSTSQNTRQSSSLKRNNSNTIIAGDAQWNQHPTYYSNKQNRIVGDELDHNQIIVTVKDWNPLDYNLTQNPVITDVLETGHAQVVKQHKMSPEDLHIQDLVQQTFESYYQQNVIPYIFDLQESYLRAIKLLGQ